MSKLFEGYKAIGLISSSVHHLVRYIEKINKIQVVTAVDGSFLVFNEKLQLIETCKWFTFVSLSPRKNSYSIFLGVAHSTPISALASDSRFLFTASECEIFAWKHGHKWVSDWIFPFFLLKST